MTDQAPPYTWTDLSTQLRNTSGTTRALPHPQGDRPQIVAVPLHGKINTKENDRRFKR